MAWIEVHQSLPSHRKTLEAAAQLDIEPQPLVGHLVCLWLWALDNAPDGNLTAPDRVLERAAGWAGQPGLLVEVLIQTGFLHRDGDELLIHDWEAYAGRLVERRKANAERMRQARAARALPSKSARAAHVQTTCAARAGATGPDLTKPNPTGPERGEEEGVLGGETVAAAAAPPPVEVPRSIHPVPKPEPRIDRFALVLDGIKALDPSVVIGGDRDRNAKAVNGSQAPPELIAEAYVALMRGEWDDPFVAKRGSLHAVVDNIGGYVTGKHGLNGKGGETHGPGRPQQRARGGSPIRHV